MEQIIITELGRWEPRIVVDDINISYDRNYQQVLIRINYTIIATNDVRVANIKLNRS
jgi:phage baseplate assembly protein W